MNLLFLDIDFLSMGISDIMHMEKQGGEDCHEVCSF